MIAPNLLAVPDRLRLGVVTAIRKIMVYVIKAQGARPVVSNPSFMTL